MRQPFRLASGGRIDRARPLRFSFDGRTLEGYAGDTLASALLANGVHFVGRSFKYHRPRGISAAGAEEPNALVQLQRPGGRSDPNLRATDVELYAGLTAQSQNRWPTLGFDVGVVNDLFSPLLTAGFYYKTFMWPASWWKSVYEPKIRAAAGLGKAPVAPDPDRYLHRHAHCDVLVVGAGPSGLMAALAAGRAGARVILCERDVELGGSLIAESGRLGTVTGDTRQWLASVAAELADLPDVQVLTRTTCFAYGDHNYLGLVERVADNLPAPPANRPRERLWRVRARQVVLATGAIERPLVFADNDRPGIMLASAARSYVNRYGVLPGSKVVVVTNNDSAYATALDLHAAGAAIEAVVDLRLDPQGTLPTEARAAGFPVLTGSAVVGTDGRSRVNRIHVGRLESDGRLDGRLPRAIRCDTLLVSGGWNPTVHLYSQSRGKVRYDAGLAAFVPGPAVQAQSSVGACSGDLTLAGALKSGAEAGCRAASDAGFAAQPIDVPSVQEPAMEPLRAVWRVPGVGSTSRQKAFVDQQNDVTAKDLGLAVREGFTSVEHVKRYTTTGMATDQGKTSNVNALGIVAAQLGTDIPSLGVTTFRPPYTPTTFGAFAGANRGDLFDPVRVTPMHDWHVAEGAAFEDVGQWKRARFYPRAGEDMHAAVRRECKQTRAAVGMFDASTLGKIDLQGPDSAELLNRVYTNAWTKLEVGRCRYGLMLRDDGMIFDDGVTTRLAPDRFHMTTTTGGAARVLAWLEEWLQTEWPDLRVYCTAVTEQWAVIALQGPASRALLADVTTGIDLGPDAFPHLAMREASVAGVPARIFRISFTGEMGYEVNVPASYGLVVWKALWNAGQKHGVVAYGTEAMHVMRAEKGYIIVGQETDGTVTPFDLGMQWIVSKQKPDFIGKRGLARADMQRPDRKQLVGLLTESPKTVLDEGAQIVERPGGTPPVPMLGHVTSSYFSPALDRSIALALVKGGQARTGETVYVPTPQGRIAARIVAPVFVDPDGARLNG